MKKLFLFSLILISLNSFAQVKEYMKDSKLNNLVGLQDSIQSTLNDFKYTGVDSGTDLSGKMYSVSLVNQSGKTVSIQYRKDDIGDVSIYGPYDELYLLWKKYFNDKADKDRVKFTGDRIRNDGNFNFVKQNDSWRIFRQ
jgi:hypothetical protein